MRIHTRCFIYLMLALLLTACASQPAKLARTTKAQSRSQKPLPARAPHVNQSVSNEAQPLFFNVSVHNLDAREFFMGLIIDSNENIVVHPEVSGTISLQLKNVSLAEVLNVVEKVYGYDCEKTDMGYIVYPATLQTKIFKIDRLDLLREGISNTRVTSGQNSTQNNNQQNNNNQQGNNSQGNNYPQGGNSQNGNNNQQTSQIPASWIRTTSETDFWQELDDTLHAIVAIDPQASVRVNQQSGVVVVRAKPMQLQEVERFIGATQNQIGRQVILEAKIMEVILDDSHQDGVNWRILAQNGLDTARVFTGFGVPEPTKFASVFTLGSKSGDNFTAFVELLETQGKTNVLSSPRISTLNNQKAIIKVGRDEYFITSISANTISTGNALTGLNNTALPTAIMSSFFSGIALDVTPQIDDNENVTLHIHPSITKVENLEKLFTIYGEEYSLPTALNTVRESDSIVKAQNGQVIVLGGLMQETEIENKEGVTGLARIPFIGHLFRVDTGKTQKSELIILLKASIIEDSSDWKNNRDLPQQHFEQLKAKPLWK